MNGKNILIVVVALIVIVMPMFYGVGVGMGGGDTKVLSPFSPDLTLTVTGDSNTVVWGDDNTVQPAPQPQPEDNHREKTMLWFIALLIVAIIGMGAVITSDKDHPQTYLLNR